MRRTLTNNKAKIELFDSENGRVTLTKTMLLPGIDENNLRSPCLYKKDDLEYICFPKLENFNSKKTEVDRSLSLYETNL